jgi:hypothetical protein
MNMKTLLLVIAGVASLMLLAQANSAFAGEKGKGKEVTITGEAKCAKCMLHESDQCQTVIQVEGKKGKMTTYYLADNDTAKTFHENVCKAAKKVTATGTVKKAAGKQELTVSKIELVQ